jgi:Domain of unknown function (DUF4232)
MRSLSLVLTAATALILAGCGGSASPSSAGQASVTTNQSSTPPATSSTTGSTRTTASTPAATTTTAPAATTPSICRASELSASFLGGQAATGHGLLGFALRNISSQACVGFGYPGVQFLTRSGQPLPTVPTHTHQDFFGTLANHPLRVDPGATVSFRLGVTHGAASTAGCATAYALQIIPPNDTVTLRVAIPDGAYECQTTTVSPLQAGTSAYP